MIEEVRNVPERLQLNIQWFKIVSKSHRLQTLECSSAAPTPHPKSSSIISGRDPGQGPQRNGVFLGPQKPLKPNNPLFSGARSVVVNFITFLLPRKWRF
jgi:hypothetical protein